MIYRFDPIDRTQMQLVGKLTPGQRLHLMLHAHKMAVIEAFGYTTAPSKPPILDLVSLHYPEPF